MGRLRSKLSYANITATIALFVALGGTSYAVSSLPRNSVGARQLRSGAVGSSEVRKGAVRSKQIHDRSVGVRDLSKNVLTTLRGPQGPIGPQGPVGPSGASLSSAVNSGGRVVSGQGGG